FSTSCKRLWMNNSELTSSKSSALRQRLSMSSSKRRFKRKSLSRDSFIVCRILKPARRPSAENA
ncbi:MAG: hypothetical protein WA584_10675, partial [Pyrinomonadaceae bacterium]